MQFNKTFYLFFLFLSLAMISCQSESGSEQAPAETVVAKKLEVSKEPWGQSPDGPVDLYRLTNANGLEVSIINYGGIITSILTPDKDGRMDDIVLGFESLEPYLGEHPYFGAIIGRYGNRIAKGQFSLNGERYSLAQNNGANHLHGGNKGFDKVLWTAKEVQRAQAVGVQLNYTSPDGEEGYPGTLEAQVTYLLNDKNELEIEYEATTDKTTICNLTNHAYFNLGGIMNPSILNHLVTINAGRYTPVDVGLIPTGELASVTGTPFDFRQARLISDALKYVGDAQLVVGKGIDHNFVLNRRGDDLELVASAMEPGSGRVLQVFTTEPGLQFYTGNFLDGSIVGKKGRAYPFRAAFCMETQHFPDSPNKPDFPSVVLEPEETYKSTTVYKFSVANMATGAY